MVVYLKTEKMFSNKFAFALVLIGLISVSNMVSSAAFGNSTDNSTTTLAPTTNNLTTTTLAPTTNNETTTMFTGSTTFNNDTTTPANGSGYPSISYGMLFSVCGALFYLIF